MIGDRAEAERKLKAAYDADHNTLRIVDGYARFEAGIGRTDLAIDAYSEFEKVMPRHPSWWTPSTSSRPASRSRP
ncbi:hypothetical protein GCM10025880_01700 [Methylorubrum aminovorans]|nr:hypothetical protein GCM10025880_01700 [Methylorubrum aminovorans]